MKKGLGILSIAVLTVASAPASAQVIAGIDDSFDTPTFSQALTDAVTQGFRQRDRVFFEEGAARFEQIIQDLQRDRTEPALTIEPVLDDWQPLEPAPDSGR